MVDKCVKKDFEKYISKQDHKWEFANNVLYDMCDSNPNHSDPDIIVGKILLIGRSYAAAIERRKDVHKDVDNDTFYYSVVAPQLHAVGNKLDAKINAIKKGKGTIKDNICDILDTHCYLMNIFNAISNLNKRSLASKYLHFHCREKFFIFDSRAQGAVKQLVTKPEKIILNSMKVYDNNIYNDNGDKYYDKEYGDFVCRMIELQNYLKEEMEMIVSPRILYSFLLSKSDHNGGR